MPFSYHPPTRTHCPVCEEIEKSAPTPIIDSHNGKASSANNFPVHNWYNFVLGYTPEFPNYIINRDKIVPSHFVVDPFMGSGTTLVACKQLGIPSAGVDANDYFIDVAKTKLDWKIDLDLVRRERDKLLPLIEKEYADIEFVKSNGKNGNLPLFASHHLFTAKDYANEHRPEMMDVRYLSDAPFTRADVIRVLIEKNICDEVKHLFRLAVSSIVVPVSNIRYGPGMGLITPKEDMDVLKLFREKINRMIFDLERVDQKARGVTADVYLGDSRNLDQYFASDSVDFMITSPPYPGDHEYTKYTKLEFMFMGYTANMNDFRKVRKRMLRGATTNIYKDDNDAQHIGDFKSIQEITTKIDRRLKQSGATSGFEKLYTKLVREYFGGMYLVFQAAHKVLRTGGRFSLLVSDSHAFKMVHIRSAHILAELAEDVGYKKHSIELWQDKVSTSHKYNIQENILTIEK